MAPQSYQVGLPLVIWGRNIVVATTGATTSHRNYDVISNHQNRLQRNCIITTTSCNRPHHAAIDLSLILNTQKFLTTIVTIRIAMAAISTILTIVTTIATVI